MSEPTGELRAKQTARMIALGAWVRRHRVAAGLTQRSMAKLAGISNAQISCIENGLHSPAVDTLERVCLTFGKELWQAIKGIDEEM